MPLIGIFKINKQFCSGRRPTAGNLQEFRCSTSGCVDAGTTPHGCTRQSCAPDGSAIQPLSAVEIQAIAGSMLLYKQPEL